MKALLLTALLGFVLAGCSAGPVSYDLVVSKDQLAAVRGEYGGDPWAAGYYQPNSRVEEVELDRLVRAWSTKLWHRQGLLYLKFERLSLSAPGGHTVRVVGRRERATGIAGAFGLAPDPDIWTVYEATTTEPLGVIEARVDLKER